MEQGGASRFHDVRRFDEVDSTNRVVADLAREGQPEGVVVVADHQTAGRGRRGRMWEAPPGSSLLVSVLLRPSVDPSLFPLATVAAGVAMAEACARAGARDVRLKWPNDLVCDEAKLGGILCEVIDGAVVVGVGVNAGWTTGLPDGATSLGLLTGGEVDREALLEVFLRRLDQATAELDDSYDRGRLVARYRRLCATLGRRVRITADDEVTGRAMAVGPDGGLLVEVDGAGGRVFSAGDVIHLRHDG